MIDAPRSRIFALAAACTLGAACSGPSEPHGSPVLTQVYWIAGASQALVWSKDPSVALVSPVPPFVTEIDFVFDRRIDGTLIEDPVTGRPKDPPAIHASWPGMTAAESSSLIVDYNSAARYGGISSYLFARPAVGTPATLLPGLPSDKKVSFQLDISRITSAYGEAATVGENPIPVITSVFSISLADATAPVAPTFEVPLTFSNRLPATVPTTSPFIHVRSGGVEVPYKLLADASVSSRWYVTAADCLGTWPASATFTVTIDAGLVDAFGGALAQGASAKFSTVAGTNAADAACVLPEAGVSDAGDVGVSDAGDGSGDGGAGDAEASADVDGGVPDSD